MHPAKRAYSMIRRSLVFCCDKASPKPCRDLALFHAGIVGLITLSTRFPPAEKEQIKNGARISVYKSR